MRFGISTVKRMVGTLVVLLAIVGTLGTSASAQEWRRHRHERREHTRVYYYTTPRSYYYTTPRAYYYTTPRTYYYNQNTWRLRRMERRHHDHDRDRW
ncbi:MAG TPA: hypothetical protein VFA21_00125 [Pyrinomonadaceae bacterium]|nr:hypothetical protein [Pyrinomonadaceae bacterium]